MPTLQQVKAELIREGYPSPLVENIPSKVQNVMECVVENLTTRRIMDRVEGANVASTFMEASRHEMSGLQFMAMNMMMERVIDACQRLMKQGENLPPDSSLN